MCIYLYIQIFIGIYTYIHTRTPAKLKMSKKIYNVVFLRPKNSPIDLLKTGVVKAHDNITYVLKDQYSNTLGFFFL